MPHLPTREEVQKLLGALLITRKEALTTGVPLTLLDKDYKEQEGTRIPFRQLGYSCLLDFLQSLKGGLSIKYRNGAYWAHPIVTDEIRHVSSLVAGQNSKNNNRGIRRTFRPSPCYPRVMPPAMRLDSTILAEIVRMVKSNPGGLHISRVLEYAKRRLNYFIDSYDLTRQLRAISHEIIVERDVLYSATGYHRQQSGGRQFGTYEESRNVAASPRADGKYCDALPAGFSDNEDEREDDFGPRVSDKIATNSQRNEPQQPPIIERFDDSAKFVDKKNAEVKTAKPIDENHENEDDKEKIAALINERTRIRLRKLIEKYPDGIWCRELPKLFQKEYTIALNYEELGFDSVIDYALHLPEIFHYTRPMNMGDFKLYNAKAAIPNHKEIERPKAPSLAALRSIDEPIEALPTVLLNTTIERLVPDGVMRMGETVAQICVTELNRGIHEYIDVFVVEVYTPSFFWIQLLKRMAKFNAFMNELHEFYSIHAKKYSMPIAIMERGMNCCCMYDGKWHRAIIKSVLPDNSIKIEFYDYGTVKSYPASCIHFLHRSFASLPAQAIPCGLYNVKPVNDTKWPSTVSREFVLQVTEALVATIASTDTDSNSMLVGLTNTQGDEDFHINDWMVQSGLAIYGKMGETVDLNDRSYDDPRCPIIIESNNAISVKSDGVACQALSTIIEDEQDQQRLVDNSIETNETDAAAPMFQRYLNEHLRLLIRVFRSDLESSADNGTRAEPASIDCFKELVTFFHSIFPSSNDVTTTTTTKNPANYETPMIPPLPKNYVFTRDAEIDEKKTKNVSEYTKKRNDDCVNEVERAASRSSLDNRIGHRDETFQDRASKIFQQFSNDISPNIAESCSKNVRADFAPLISHVSASFVANSSANDSAKSYKEKRNLFETSLTVSAKNFIARMETINGTRLEKSQESSSNVRLCDTNPFRCSMYRASASPALNEKSSLERSHDSSDFQAPKSPKMGSQSCENDESRDQRNSEIDEFRIEREKLLETKRLGHEESRIQDNSNNPFSNNYVPPRPPPVPPRTMSSMISRAVIANEDSIGYVRCDVTSQKLENLSSINGNEKLNDDKSSKGEFEIEPKNTWERKNYNERWNLRKIQLTRSLVFLIIYKNEGWITVEEFAAAFTNKPPQAIMKVPQILRLQGVEMSFLKIARSENSSLFNELDRTSLGVPRGYENTIGDFLNLIPLKKAPKILLAMKIIERGQFDRAVKHKIFPEDSSVYFDIYTLINAWGEVKQALNLTK